MNSFDIDGVIYIRKDLIGVRPGPDDIIITGRSFEERKETETMLFNAGIFNRVYYNPLPYADKTRESSGLHKADVLNKFKDDIVIHFEDDPIQINAIKKLCPWVNIVHLNHELTNKENMRHV